MQNNTSPWFQNWFNTKYYHILYQHRDYKEAQFFIDNLVDYLQIPAQSQVLDLACGKGRHAIYLHKKGLEVTGLDLSTESIAHARQFQNETLHFDTHDMRKVYPKTFDYIFNLFTSFGYFENDAENLQTIQAMAQMLKPDGYLLIDFLNAHKTIKNLVASEQKTLNNIEFNITRKLQNGFIVKDISFNDAQQHFQFQERVKAISLQDFKDFFAQAELQLCKTFGSFALEAYHPESSDRLIMLLQKK